VLCQSTAVRGLSAESSLQLLQKEPEITGWGQEEIEEKNWKGREQIEFKKNTKQLDPIQCHCPFHSFFSGPSIISCCSSSYQWRRGAVSASA
jgi:hypothetical protein